eukprot:CAMPEP_0173406472 /NCGR_PEP_ID=MMETSP1356-20130122/64684_1 /TAXON_ID=77927 ORGANISM="Hemiselmis virescens, Strain PCC157" /NCGR_SAMPLE_ID=MMETSP1356 /ASSEMBLY_ACC=CAM_ASM_000847 /LENGTH=70 /DNA_ID=CAMNT_0014367473 /DNA_START=71 /DNA_END=280 /DNA_ORIENTATION=-
MGCASSKEPGELPTSSSATPAPPTISPEKRLLAAAVNGRTEEVKNLVQANADIETKDMDGRTALIWSARW